MGNAGIDLPAPIGFGQTISQPTTVRMMLEWLDVQPGDKILDVGSGSGWTSALLGELTGSKGCVFAVEIIPELARFGRNNCLKTDLRNVRFFVASEQLGLPSHAPYDRILVGAAADELPDELVAQLKPGGKMVLPVRQDILEIEKMMDGHLDIVRHSGFVFVPLVREYNGV